MKLNNFLKITLSVLILLFTFGCAKNNNNNSRNDIVLDAYRLIDEQRTDEAIELLESSLSKEPDNSEHKAVLASAYAHKSGIKIQKLVPIITQSDKLKKLSEKSDDVDKSQSLGSRVNAESLHIAKILIKFSGFFEAYASIPLVDKKQSAYLIQAIYILNDIGNKIKPEDVIYRAILEVVLLKYYLAEGFVGEFLEPQTKNEKNCKLDLGNINQSIIKMGKLLIDIYHDVGFANPKQAEDMKQRALQTSASISNLTLATTAVTVLDEAANIFLKQTAIQNGFGKIIKCGGN